MKKIARRIVSAIVVFAVVMTSVIGVGPLKFMSVVEAEAGNKTWNGKSDTSWFTGEYDYYEISNAEQLAGLSELVNGGESFSGITIKLTKDIVLNNTKNYSKWSKKAPKNNWTPIGSSNHSFGGIFNGDGHKITGLYCNKSGKFNNWFSSWTESGGLFGYICNAYILNLNVEKAYVSGWSSSAVIAARGEDSIIVSCSAQNSTVFFWKWRRGRNTWRFS